MHKHQKFISYGSPNIKQQISTSPFRISPIPIIHSQTPDRARYLHFPQNPQQFTYQAHNTHNQNSHNQQPNVRQDSQIATTKSLNQLNNHNHIKTDDHFQLQEQYNKLQQQFQQLQYDLENQKRSNQHSQSSLKQDSNGRSFTQQALDLQVAVLKMEVEKCKFEIQSRDRQVSFLEERLLSEEEERLRLDLLYSKRQDHESEAKEQVQKLKEMNALLESRLKTLTKDIGSKYKCEIEDLNQKINQQQKELEQQDCLVHVLSSRKESNQLSNSQQAIEELQNEVRALKDQNYQMDKYYNDQISQLQESNQVAQQSAVSFQESKQYFENQMQELKSCYYDIIEENEKLKEGIQQHFNTENQNIMEIQKLREQILFLRSQQEDSAFFQQQEQTLTQGEIQAIGDQYLHGEIQEFDVKSLKDLKKFIKHFQIRFTELVGELKTHQIDPKILKDINEIKNYTVQPIVSFVYFCNSILFEPSNRSSDVSDKHNIETLRALQFKNDDLLDEIDKKKILLQEFNQKKALNDQNDDDDDPSKISNDIDQLYAEYDNNRIKVQQIMSVLSQEVKNMIIKLIKNKYEFIGRKPSSVSFDQSFEVQQFEF